MKRFMFFVCLMLSVSVLLPAQPHGNSQNAKWYKFSNAFITGHYQTDSAIGKLEASEVSPASRTHSISCGGNDGELHIGRVAESAIKWSAPQHIPFSAVADEDDSQFGVVAEPGSQELQKGWPTEDSSLSQILIDVSGFFSYPCAPFILGQRNSSQGQRNDSVWQGPHLITPSVGRYSVI